MSEAFIKRKKITLKYTQKDIGDAIFRNFLSKKEELINFSVNWSDRMGDTINGILELFKFFFQFQAHISLSGNRD